MMSHFMLDELVKIAAAEAHPSIFGALDKLAAGHPKCRTCGVVLKRPSKECPRCGNDTSDIFDPEGKNENAEEGGTGAQAAENEAGLENESLESGGQSSAKTAAVAALQNAAKALPPEIAAVLALGGGGYGAAKIHKISKDIEKQTGTALPRRGRLIKQSSVGRRGILNVRKPHVLSKKFGLSTPSKSFKALKARQGKSRSFVARKKR